MRISGHIISLFAALLLVLSGCTALSLGGGKGTLNLYNLTPKSTFSNNLPQVDWKLVVTEPVVTGGLDSKRIALRPQPTKLKYYAEANWTDRTGRMIQTLLIESFTNSKRIAFVGRDAISLRPDYILTSELREFQAEYFHGSAAPSVRIRLNATLIDPAGREIVASESFEAIVKSEGTDMDSIVLAFDTALGKVLRGTVEWTLARR